MFQTKEAERFLPSTTRMSRRNGFLATRLQMLHTSYEGTMSKGKTLCDGQKSTGWMQSNCWMSNSISLSLQNQLYQFLLEILTPFFQCEHENELAQYYYKPLGTCYEHFTVGPCEDVGKIFLPGGKCGCHVKLPNYHEETDQCYELGITFEIDCIVEITFDTNFNVWTQFHLNRYYWSMSSRSFVFNTREQHTKSICGVPM